jgi:hypothetical protein
MLVWQAEALSSILRTEGRKKKKKEFGLKPKSLKLLKK